MDMQRFVEYIANKENISYTKNDENGIEEHIEGRIMSVSDSYEESIEIRIENVGYIRIPENNSIEYYDDMNSFHLSYSHSDIWINGM